MFTHTNGLTLEKLEKNDLHFLLSLKKESWGSTHKISIINTLDQEKWFESLDNSPHCPKNLILTAFNNNDAGCRVGIFKFWNIDWHNRKADVAWDVFAHQRGQGFGKKIVEAGVAAAKEIGLNSLRAEILQSNVKSIKCAVYAGFYLIGTEKYSIFKSGKYINNQIYGILLNASD